jgi:hypothetical protein
LVFDTREKWICVADMECVDAPIILAIVTILAIVSWLLTPADAWVPRGRLTNPVDHAD